MYKFRINQSDYEFEVDIGTPLLWVIRDIAGLTGTKFGCGTGVCGACTVLLEGKPVRACITPVQAVHGQSVTTIEGLSENGDHPVQRAWVTQQVPQCGYCQSGFIMSTVALLSQNANPDDDAINNALGGHICRCGTYLRIRKAVKQAALLSREKIIDEPIGQ